MKQSGFRRGLASILFIVCSATGASAAEKATTTELSVPALLCLARLTTWLTTQGVNLGPTDAPIKVGAPFILGAAVEVKDGPTITALFPAPDRTGSKPPIFGGHELTCDREGRVLSERHWR